MSVFIILNYLMLLVLVLVSVAFLTLLERKILSYIQVRSGPNKVSYLGFLQPFSDAFKLLSKELFFPSMSNIYPFFVGPGLALSLIMISWALLPLEWGMMDFKLGVLFFMCCTSLSVYFLLMAGWSSNSKYSLLGALRAVAQTVSYEVNLAMLLIGMMIMIMSFDFEDMVKFQSDMWFIVMMLPLFLMWFCSNLAELNRSPFDFVEGESELVSGFNVEYGGMSFALIFIAEYAWILLGSMIMSVFFLGGYNFLMFLSVGILGAAIIWVRGTLPRYRYDKLMDLAWKSYLPVVLNYLIFVLGLTVML